MTRTGSTVGLGVWSGLALVVAGTVFADGAVLTSAYRGSSPVSDEQLCSLGFSLSASSRWSWQS